MHIHSSGVKKTSSKVLQMSGSISVIEKDKVGNGGYGYWGQVGVTIFIVWPGKASLIRQHLNGVLKERRGGFMYIFLGAAIQAEDEHVQRT